jgi:uncharacterized protein
VLNLIDRRLNGRNKSVANRERFLRRYKEQIRKSVQDMVGERSITDMDKGGNVNIPVKDISEPQIHHAPGGDRETVHPGNREFVKGDTIQRPGGGGSGESADDFVFSLSREEFLDLFFDDLELPRLVRGSLGQVVEKKWINAGFVSEGAPCNLSVGRTLKTALGRRIALAGPIRAQLAEARARLEEARNRPGTPEERRWRPTSHCSKHGSRGCLFSMSSTCAIATVSACPRRSHAR